MLEIRFHGRGGQGAVTSAELLAQAAIAEGKYARAFPSFGPERRGAPVAAFCRIDDRLINLRTNIDRPNVVIVLDPSLFSSVDVTRGLQEKGFLVINTKKEPQEFRTEGLNGIASVNAAQIAQEILKRPVTNTVMLGALLRMLPAVKVDSLLFAIKDRFDKKIADRNVEAVRRAYNETRTFFNEKLENKTRGGKRKTASGNKSRNNVSAAVNSSVIEIENLPKTDDQYLWTELEPGCVVTRPGGSRVNLTGDWRSSYPILEKDRCIKCGLCWIYCPDAAQIQDKDGYFSADLNYCKGCGICAKECPTGAIHMEKELEM